MGRYTTAQSFTDSNTNLPSIPYAQAAGKGGEGAGAAAAKGGGAAPVVEKTPSVKSSNAGASSSLFHIYKNARRVEMARQDRLKTAEEKAKANAEVRERVEKLNEEEAEKTKKRAEKRRRRKKRQREARSAAKAEAKVAGGEKNEQEESGSATKRARTDDATVSVCRLGPANRCLGVCMRVCVCGGGCRWNVACARRSETARLFPSKLQLTQHSNHLRQQQRRRPRRR